MERKKAVVCGCLTGIVFEISLVLGRLVSVGNLGGVRRLAVETLLGMVLFTVLYLLLLWKGGRYRNNGFRRPRGKKIWLLVWLVMFLCYLPCYISFFPGIMSYDSERITEQALGLRPFDNFQPFAHTVLWTACIKLEQWCGIGLSAIVLYSLLQMLVLTGVFTYVLSYMVKRGVHKGIVVFAFLMYAFCPSIVLFSFITTKDILFGAFVLLFVLLLAEFCEEPGRFLEKKGKVAGFVLLGLAACLFRNNMIYVMALTALVVCVAFRQEWKKTAAMFLLMLGSYFIVVGPVYGVLGVQPGYARELLSVPLSQLANVYQKGAGEMDTDDRELLLEFAPDIGKYQRQFADPIKLTFNEEKYAREGGAFWDIWLEYLRKEPWLYVDAFLVLNAPLWYMESDTVDPYISLGLFSKDYTFEYRDALPAVREFYTAVAEYHKAEDGILRWPVIRQFFSVALPIWVLFAAGCTLIAEKRWKRLLSLLPLLLLWMTYLLGPVSNFRYMFPIIISYPAILMLVLHRKKAGRNRWERLYRDRWWKITD